MAELLAHRGPDASGIWVSDDERWALGHRRLAIRDLSEAGHQPMISSCRRFIIVYNGEVYGLDPLIRELRARGRKLRGNSDTEVILESCAEFGILHTVRRLTGMFAFALLDRFEERLYLTRDRFGIKPLYWGLQGGFLFFASELRAIRSLSFFDARVDRDSVGAFVRSGYVPAPLSILHDVEKVMPGTVVSFHSGGSRTVDTFWDLADSLTDSVDESSQVTSVDFLRELDDHLTVAVRRRMVSDVPVGSFLSGGIDSSLVTALMAEHSVTPIRTFSIGFEESSFNEAPFAAAIATHLGTIHTELYVTSGDAQSVVPKLASIYDEPFADPSQIPTLILSRMTSEHVKVVLSGDGGDEIFGGYSRYFDNDRLWRLSRWMKTPPGRLVTKVVIAQNAERLNRWSEVLPMRFRRTDAGSKIQEVLRWSPSYTRADLYLRQLSHWPEPSRIIPSAIERSNAVAQVEGRQRISDPFLWMQYVDATSYLPDDILVKVDRASMAFGLEVRVPLLDHHVAEFVWRHAATNPSLRGRGKWALEHVLEARVPRHLFDRPKSGFGIPISEWLRGHLREWASDLLSPDRLARQNLVDTEIATQTWEAHLAGSSHGYQLWNLLMLQSWLEANGVSV